MRRLALLALAPLSLSPLACGSTSSGPTQTATFSTYAPQGCAYTVTPPASRGFTDLALDDPKAAVDPTQDAPVRVRIGLGGGATAGQPGYADPTTSAVFTWETAAPTHAAQVRIGTSASSMTDVHTGYSWTTPPPTVGIGTGEPPGYFHEVHVCGLQPGTTYFYQVGGGAGAGAWSATQTFGTPPAAGPVLVGFSGDSRDDVNVFQLVQERMRDAGVQLQLMSGDLVLWGTQESLYAEWLDAIWKDPNDPTRFLTLGQMPILSVGGNHENQSSQYFANWALPGDGDWAETYASFDLSSAHVVLINDEAIATGTGDETSTQLAWLDADLAKADSNRAARPFVVVVNHRGEFSTSNHGMDSDVLETRAQLAPLFARHHVDVVINGHDHNYERTNPIVPAANPADAPVVQSSPGAGTTYVVCAGSGAGAYEPGTPAPWMNKTVGFGTGTPYVGVYGLLSLDKGKLSLEAYGLKAAGGGVAGDVLIDSLVLMR
jgi:predicted phosphodiesterase